MSDSIITVAQVVSSLRSISLQLGQAVGDWRHVNTIDFDKIATRIHDLTQRVARGVSSTTPQPFEERAKWAEHRYVRARKVIRQMVMVRDKLLEERLRGVETKVRPHYEKHPLDVRPLSEVLGDDIKHSMHWNCPQCGLFKKLYADADHKVHLCQDCSMRIPAPITQQQHNDDDEFMRGYTAGATIAATVAPQLNGTKRAIIHDVIAYLDSRAEDRDGDYGKPTPNEAMVLSWQLRKLLRD